LFAKIGIFLIVRLFFPRTDLFFAVLVYSSLLLVSTKITQKTNRGVVKMYNATNSMARFCNKKLFFSVVKTLNPTRYNAGSVTK
jgi:hypothetical protein